MTKKQATKLIHFGDYMAEVNVELVYMEDEWSPYVSVNDAMKLDDVREALQREDFVTAARLSRVYRLSPLVV